MLLWKRLEKIKWACKLNNDEVLMRIEEKKSVTRATGKKEDNFDWLYLKKGLFTEKIYETRMKEREE